MASRDEREVLSKVSTTLEQLGLTVGERLILGTTGTDVVWQSRIGAAESAVWKPAEPWRLLRYRYFLEQKSLAPSTIAAGIRRVRGAKRLVRIGNWLTVDQSRTLLRESASDSLRGKRDRAILALLIGCGLRRAELLGQRVEGHAMEPTWALGLTFCFAVGCPWVNATIRFSQLTIPSAEGNHG